ncbi:MAG TPA: 3-oxoacyl-ACP synthase III [Acidimicrobiales bacterium]
MSSRIEFMRPTIWSVGHAEAPEVVTSAWIDEQLAETYDRCGIRPGLLETVAGIVERRWWPEEVSFDEAAAKAGVRALELADVAPSEVDLLISTSVCKHHLEPSVACSVHFRLGLGPQCINYDLGNACLGFVNAMQVGAMAIETGHAQTVLIVDGEGSRYTQLATIERLRQPTATALDVYDQFASLTLGSGAAAMVMGGPRTGAHRFIGGISRAATQNHNLCVGDLDTMRTDTAALLEGGLALALEAFEASVEAGWEWKTCDRFVMHQVSAVHTRKLCELIGVDMNLVPLTYPGFGNMGPAAVPYTLSTVADEIVPGERVLLMGIGSGLNVAAAELIW